MGFVDIVLGSLESAWLTLVDYLSFHVLLCLIPAFFIAGAMMTFISTDAIVTYLGPTAKKRVAYPLAAIAGLLLAVCSCTVLPLFVGIYRKGAGLGPAITFLFAAPAVNILALVYTGTLIGMDIALARAVLAIGFSILIGLVMALSFPVQVVTTEVGGGSKVQRMQIAVNRHSLLVWSLVALSLAAGISMVVIEVELVILLVYVLGLMGLVGLSLVSKSTSYTLFVWLVYLLFVGTSRMAPYSSSLMVGGVAASPQLVNMLVKLAMTLVVAIPLLFFIRRNIDQDDTQEWLAETWEFFKSIFPLLLAGVVIAGCARFFLPEDIIISLVGSNTVVANLIAVVFGVFMYFPTLMEVPVARLFLDLGMARGPLLSYLLADPELSIQSILVTRKYLGDRKNVVYVLYVALFTTLGGLIFGLFLGEGISWL